jgi:hypothetical protein
MPFIYLYASSISATYRNIPLQCLLNKRIVTGTPELKTIKSNPSSRIEGD